MIDLKILIPLISGGLAGAILNYLFNSLKEKQQTISYTFLGLGSSLPIQKKDGAYLISSIASKDEIDNDSKLFYFMFLFKNSGNKDYGTFEFGISGTNDIEFISLIKNNEEHLHEMAISPTPLLSDKKTSSIKITLSPFNRKDIYDIDIFFLCPRSNFDPTKEIKIDAKLPVKFKNKGLTYFAVYLSKSKTVWEHIWKIFIKPNLLQIIVYVIFLFGLYYFSKEITQYLIERDLIEIREKKQPKTYKPLNDDGIEE